jgi:hypothetical protein
VPTIRDIGLWGPKIRRAYSNMGILGFADAEELSRNDERIAAEFDARLGRSNPKPRGQPEQRCEAAATGSLRV